MLFIVSMITVDKNWVKLIVSAEHLINTVRLVQNSADVERFDVGKIPKTFGKLAFCRPFMFRLDHLAFDKWRDIGPYIPACLSLDYV